MLIRKTSPTQVQLENLSASDVARLEDVLTYTNRTHKFNYARLTRAEPYMRKKLGDNEFEARLKEAREGMKGCLFLPYSRTYAGLTGFLQEKFPGSTYVDDVEYPEDDLLPWAKKPDKQLRYYQEEAVEALLAVKHGAIEHATGLGKSMIIVHLVKRMGGDVVITAPTVNIARQLYNELCEYFGNRFVGLFGDGTKEYKKRIVVAVADSLCSVEKGSDEWFAFGSKSRLICDESHTLPAKTLQRMCFEVMGAAAERYFLSATQLRADGLDLMLRGIIGPTVHTMTARRGIEEGFLAVPKFRMHNVCSDNPTHAKDSLAENRLHFLKNKHLHKVAAKLANKAWEQTKKPVLILVAELSQVPLLMEHLKYDFQVAHGGSGEGSMKHLPPQFRNPDNEKLVRMHNQGKIPILIGTKAVAVGTDFQTVGHLFYLMGLGAEVQLRQAFGRGTRRPPGKDSFVFNDFCVYNVVDMVHHADIRREICKDIWAEPEEFKWR